MGIPDPRISIADLSASGLRLHFSAAVAVARELMLRAARGELPGIPSAQTIRLLRDGAIEIEGPVAAGRSVERAARLVDTLLPGFDAPPEWRVPGALRLVVARGMGTLDLPVYESLDDFASALDRFAVPDMPSAIQGLCQAWSAASFGEEEKDPVADPASAPADPVVPAPELTISDVRRARRATGLTLTEISERSRIPVSLLRELEWGYFVNWPSGHYGHAQLVRYARAAGLDDQVVLSAVWPVLRDAVRTRGTVRRVVEGSIVDAPVPSTSLVRVGPALPVVRNETARRRRRVLAALAIPALVAVGLVPAMWVGDDDEPSSASPAVATRPARAAVTPASGGNRPADHLVQPAQRAPRAASAGSTPSAALRPVAAVLRADAAFSPAFASTGSAMFDQAAGPTLRVTSIVNDRAKNFHARPSPDGRMIAFDSDRDGARAVYVAEASGRGVRRVSGEGFAAVPSWSPDARRLVYSRPEPDRPKVWNLWMVDLATGHSERLTSHRVGQPWGASWFPDGERILYGVEDRLVVRGLDGSGQRIYHSPRKGRLVRTPAVSPDGRRVMFQVYRDGGWLLDLDDGSMRKVLSDPTAEEFTWSPDGGRVAYHSRQSGRWSVWIMAPR